MRGPRGPKAVTVTRATSLDRASRAGRTVRRWNEILLAANALDHTPVGPGENRLFGEQLGPHRTSRAFAIVHIAIFDTVNAIAGGHKSYTGLPPASRDISMHAAIAQAAHDTLVALYPSQKLSFDELLAEDLDQIRDRQAQRRGTALGSRAADAILALRTSDGSQFPEQLYGSEYVPDPGPGKWRQDPIALQPIALGSLWNRVKPFVLQSAGQFQPPPPPAPNSSAYMAAFDEVKPAGRCGHHVLGVEVSLRVLAPDHRHPCGRRTELDATRCAVQQQRRPELHPTIPGLPVRARHLRGFCIRDPA